MDVLLFGDHTADQYPLLHYAVHSKDNAVLSTFLERVSVALREETRKLPKARRELIPDFLRVGDLLEHYYQRAVKVPELESAIVTIAQLAHYLGYFEQHTSEIPVLTNTRSVGLCTGLLAAAAVSSARSLSELIPIAVECVRIAFRVGKTVGTARDALDIGTDAQASWSTIVTNTNLEAAQAALDSFHQDAGVPVANQAYVSAVSIVAVTITGPPSTTKRLFQQSAAFQNSQRVPVPVYAPYHAAHLYSEADIRAVIDEQSRDLLQQFQPLGLVHSASSGMNFTASNALELVEQLVLEIFCYPVRWDRLLEELVSEITSLSHTQCHVRALGITNVTASLVSALKAGGQQSISVMDHTSWKSDDKYNGRTQNDKIAIVGMSGRFPNAATHEALWDLLMKGLDVHKEVPKDRFDAQTHCDPSGKGKNKSHTPYGCFIDEPGLFDPRFFNMSPREAAQTDPMGRLALTTAYEALEMSGYVPNRTPSTKLNRIGTFYGQTSDDWREINAAENVDTYFITGGVRAFAPGRINYYFKFSGPSFSVDTACSSSLAAIQLACTSLWAGDCDTACAGGLNVLTNPDIFSGLSKGQFLSKTGSCKTYDNDADGYCRGDSCASVILKRYEDAVKDKDHILGSILATGTNHSAEAVSITHPHAGAQEFLYKKILADAGRDAHDVSYVEMHGTGTQAGDGIEMTSVTNAFAPPHRRRRPDQPLRLGAIKANIGHGEAASGISALVKVLMIMRESQIPPNVGIKGVMNKTFPSDLGERNVHIPQQAVPLPRNGADKRLIFLNNFSAAGGNTAALLEDGPLRTTPLAKDPRSHQIVTVTARAIASLKRNITNLLEYLSKHPQTDLSSLAYTTTARRIQHNYRVSFSVSDIAKVPEALNAQIKDSYSPIAMVPTSTAFVFTGQGSQYTGLGQVLYDHLKAFRDDIDELNKLAVSQGLPSFMPLLAGADVTTLSPVVVQLAMSCIQVALAHMWCAWGLKPLAVIGHSLGEYAALHIAGVISANDMLRLVGRRAELLVSMCTEFTHGMLAVKGSEDSVMDVLGSSMTEVACKNGPEETVLCGPMDAVNKANESLLAAGFKSTMLKVPFAFHSAQVEPILDPFRAVAQSVVFNKPQIPVLSPLTGDVVHGAGVINADYMCRHARETVDFNTALDSGLNEAVFTEKTAWVEIGAHPVCSNMVKATLGSSTVTAPSLRRGEDPWKTITGSLTSLFQAGVYVNFDEYHREFNECHEILVLPTYAFDSKKYWLDYHNNWTLTKGEAHAAPKELPAPEPTPSKFSTTSCQRIIKEELQANTGTVVFQTNLADPKLATAVQGHLVNQNPLLPSSLWADQALTVADYLYKGLRPKADKIGLNVCQMEVPKSLVAKVPPPPEGEHIQIEGTADLEARHALIKFRSVTPDGKKTLTEHAHCTVKYEDINEWYESWDMTSYMVKNQIDSLKTRLATGGAHKVLRGMAYKLFKNFVDYSPEFRGMEEVIFDGKDAEATATISFQTSEKNGSYHTAPFWIDSLAHLSGFIVNGTDLIDSDNFLYISHGWGSMRFARELSADKKYTSYVRMLPKPGNVRAGDVYIFEGEELVGVVGGLKFQQIPRKAMNAMLPPPKPAGSAPKSAAPAPKVAAKPAPIQTSTKPKASTPAAKPAKSPKTAKPSMGSVTAKVMSIVAEETDVDMAELVDEAAFENLGVDSLLSLTIAAKLREELELDIPSSLFTDNETVGALKKYFSQHEDAAAPEPSDSDSSSSDELATPDADDDNSTAPSSPPSVSEVDEKPSAVSSAGISVAKLIVAEEMGVAPAELSDQADLSEMGMDSLMSLTVLSSLREQTGVDLPSTFLVTNSTIEDIENALGMRAKPKPAPAPKPASKARKSSSKEPQLDAVTAKLSVVPKDVSNCPKATSVLLQGSTKTATKKFFLIPDGSGSATSYMNIPAVSSDVAIYGLNCPFMKNPTQWTIGVDGVSQLFINEIKRRQPQGPYYIGGWSAGGVMAYESTCQLIAAGEKVERLVLLDAPSPEMASEPLPPGFHLFMNELGLLGTGGPTATPEWLLPHFASAIRSLGEYVPQPLPKHKAPKTFAIWARSGIVKPTDPRPPCDGPEPRPMTWLLDQRTDFGDNGWGQLLGAENMSYGVMDGNHFSMVREPLSIELIVVAFFTTSSDIVIVNELGWAPEHRHRLLSTPPARPTTRMSLILDDFKSISIPFLLTFYTRLLDWHRKSGEVLDPSKPVSEIPPSATVNAVSPRYPRSGASNRSPNPPVGDD
ncbi:MAG: hypothetical protein Q9159_000893 [Coniocarpon cinnabarinum]